MFANTIDMLKKLSNTPSFENSCVKELTNKINSFGLEIVSNLRALNETIKSSSPGGEISFEILSTLSSGRSVQANLLKALLLWMNCQQALR